jgi:hypothetical protein
MTDERRFQIFISSTSDDLREQRQKIWESLVSLDYIVSGMEAFPATSDAQFEYIKQQIAQSDYYILVVAGRYGTIAENNVSYTEREFDYAQEMKLPTLVFPHRDITSLPISKTDQDQEKLELLKLFREKAARNRLCSYWTNSDELALNIIKALQSAIKTYPRPGWQRGDQASTNELLKEVHQLRAENDKLRLASSPPLSEEAPQDLKPTLKKKITFSYYMSADNKQHGSTVLSLSDILKEVSIFEPTSFDLFEECLRGAVTAKIGIDFDAVAVDRAEVDRVILSLVKSNILRINRTGRQLEIDHGDNWLAANSIVKLGEEL